MRLLPNFRARLKEALGERLEEWRPGGKAPEVPLRGGPGAEFVADPDRATEATARTSSRYAADAPWAAPASPAPRDEAAAGSRAALLARLRGPDALREAFVVKEILDRPVGLRPPRGRGIRG